MDTRTIKLEKGVPASFTGYLVPDWQFRQMNAELLEKDFLKQRLAEIPEPEESNVLVHVLIGFIAGSVTVYAIDQIGKK